LEVAADGTLYLLRGIQSWLYKENREKGTDTYHWQETLYVEQYRSGEGWQPFLANAYPTQSGSPYSEQPSVLDGDLAIDTEGQAHVAWMDDHEAWQSSLVFRLRTTTIDPAASLPQVTKHYYANGQRIASRVDGDLYYILGDHLGSTSLVVDAGGAEVGHVIYDAYGQVVENTLPEGLTDRLFTGQVWDDTIGLYFYNARYYDPLVGQFTQPDSLVVDPLDPRAWNRFSYVHGNPTNLVDPSGHNPLLIAAGVGLFALGGFGGHLAATSAGYEVGDWQWYAAVGLGGAFAVGSAGLGYAGYGGWALAAGIAGDTFIDTAILGHDLGPSLAWNVAFNVGGDVLGYTVGRVFRPIKGVSRLTPADAADLRHFGRQSDLVLSAKGYEPFRFSTWEGAIERAEMGLSDWFICRSSRGEIIGAMRIKPGNDHLQVIAIQGFGGVTGAGRRLMQAAVQESISQGFGGRIAASALSQAIPFYKKLGPSQFIPSQFNRFTWSKVDALVLLLR
jgi:RHS repeat-associated protein